MSEVKPKPHGEWSPRFWEGCDFFAWLKIAGRNNFAISPRYWWIAAIIGANTFTHACLRWRQRALFGKQIDAVPLPQEPLFVLGHWRTGTTLLHELLILDEQFTYPDSFHCFMPNHTLLSEGVFKNWLNFLAPKKRPMDNMATGWNHPQEDEFALCLLGQPSPYADLAFPNRPTIFPGSLDLSGLTPTQLRLWKRELIRFVKTLALRDPRQLVLKSPPHTARIPHLLNIFPQAKFVHIRRNPFTLFASTVNLWRALARKQGMQVPKQPDGVEERVFTQFITLCERYEEGKKLIPPGRLVEITYEDLVKDLAGTMAGVYEGLGLEGFDKAKLKIEDYAAKHKNYETNKFTITDEMKQQIQARWGTWIEHQGYSSH